MIYVCNTGPLSALAKLDRLALLQHLGGAHVLIPPMVYKELWGKIGFEAPLIETFLHTFIVAESQRNLAFPFRERRSVGIGEAKRTYHRSPSFT